MKNYKKLFSGKTDAKTLKQELVRAHVIISLLSFGVVALLMLGAGQSMYEPTLASIGSLLLVVVMFTSINTVFVLRQK